MASIGDLFINLGIKGTDKTVAALAETKKGLEGLKSASFEAKAAVVAAMYALEQLFSKSGQAGTDLTNFNTLLGGGFIQTLQKYQYAARQVGVSNDEVSGTFKNLQSVMAKTLLGQGAPAGLARVARVTHTAIGAEEVKRFSEHPEELIQLLQQYAQLEKNAALRGETLSTFGVNGNVQSGLVRNAFRPDVLASAPTYSDKETTKLDKANIAWSNLSSTVQMAIGHLNAAHGEQLVGDITKTIQEVIKLSEAFLHLSERMHLFKGIDMVFQGWVKIFQLLEGLIKEIAPGLSTIQNFIDKALDAFNETPEEAAKKNSKNSEIKSGASDLLKGLMISIFGDNPVPTASKNSGESAPRAATAPPRDFIDVSRDVAPRTPPAAATTPAPTSTAVPVINQILNFAHDGHDPQKVADTHKKSVRDAMRQSPALAGGQ